VDTRTPLNITFARKLLVFFFLLRPEANEPYSNKELQQFSRTSAAQYMTDFAPTYTFISAYTWLRRSIDLVRKTSV